ncbi:barstar family protein [Uliginosibacterium flavum]|uniref:Barstar family protein n=1 Tax=Uliginosibacterium flavum TaxID=1396831 RepID=A0ABV2TMQ5_9RHOO
MKINALPANAVQLLRRPEIAGVYQATDDTARTLFQAGPAAGFNVYRIDLGKARNADSLHRILARGLHFPDWYGGNWDALADCLTDMSWNEADGYLLILVHAETLQAADPACFSSLLEVLNETVTAWQTQKISFCCLLTGTHTELPVLGVST